MRYERDIPIQDRLDHHEISQAIWYGNAQVCWSDTQLGAQFLPCKWQMVACIFVCFGLQAWYIDVIPSPQHTLNGPKYV
jgi:hypothetical protein